MDNVTILPYDRIYKNFIDSKYLHDGHDEYYYRDQQVKQPEGGFAGLGMLPSKTIRFIFAFGSGTGMAENSASV